MRKILFLFLSILFLAGCSSRQEASSLPSSKPEPTLSSAPTPIVEQEEPLFSNYPETITAFVCHQWKETDIDNRFRLPEGESDFLRDSLVFMLYPLDDGYARIHITSRIETEYGEWIDGDYISLGDHAYSFTVQYAHCTESGFDGCSMNSFGVEGDELPGYFVIQNKTLYYLAESDDFSNYENYPACEFYFSGK
ncbi:lipoprotein [Holdemania massiliensis]|uniref:Lipoprotein n=1 Tax=Holdemania massiliensis TaxID=1468449 RepID=A0A6N7S2X0_9FIRM|nr:lipoprotein [Holdemania massiliensis]MSA70370.1 hypothetical protein [Holdemania massiliensis]MSA88099.1 hypothetical protein [Holdemania massiliensis]MSB76928.1 hypothetical protein [Holdemania massiliensis]MSC31854.1 hypothetical protein [Holdemania massiliensis]MSC38174.1 hypothetical protein [Holdemania massiliensis]